MISDILFQSVIDLTIISTNPNFDRTYNGEIRERIIRLRDEAEYIRVVLDTYPCDTPPTEAVDVWGTAGRSRTARMGLHDCECV